MTITVGKETLLDKIPK